MFQLLILKHTLLSDDKISGRGCSTKKSSYKECETHSYGEKTEKFCYCTSHFCNAAPPALPRPSLLSLLLPVLLIIASSSVYSSLTRYFHLPRRNAVPPDDDGHLVTRNANNCCSRHLLVENRTIDNQLILPRTQNTSFLERRLWSYMRKRDLSIHPSPKLILEGGNIVLNSICVWWCDFKPTCVQQNPCQYHHHHRCMYFTS